MVVIATPRRPTDRLFQSDEKQQQRQARDHLRHDQRRRGHGIEREASAELPEPRQAEPGERAENHRAGGVDDGHLQRNPRGIEDFFVVE